jgi:hypothetical protein
MRAIITAAIAALSLSFAAAPVLAAPADDNTSYARNADLGIDVSKAGSTPAEVHAYLSTLNPEAQRMVIGGCQTALAQPETVQNTTVTFCQLALTG